MSFAFFIDGAGSHWLWLLHVELCFAARRCVGLPLLLIETWGWRLLFRLGGLCVRYLLEACGVVSFGSWLVWWVLVFWDPSAGVGKSGSAHRRCGLRWCGGWECFEVPPQRACLITPFPLGEGWGEGKVKESKIGVRWHPLQRRPHSPSILRRTQHLPHLLPREKELIRRSIRDSLRKGREIGRCAGTRRFSLA